MANQGEPIEKDMAFGMARSEMEYRVEMFNKLAQTCFKKCFDGSFKNREAEMNLAETSCIDRCASKYWTVTNIIGQILSGNNMKP